MRRRLISIAAALTLCLSLCPVWALSEVAGNLDFSDPAAIPAGDGYQWDEGSGTLTLQGVRIDGTVTLPGNREVTVVTGEASSIAVLEIAKNGLYLQSADVVFDGPGELTILNRISNGMNGDTLTVAQGAKVTVEGSIDIGQSGGMDGSVLVNGTLTVSGGAGTAISAGEVVIGGSGTLRVSGERGVKVNGMLPGGVSDFTGAFTIERGGTFAADCGEYNLLVSGTFPEGFPVNTAVCFPDGYLPSDYKVTLDTQRQAITLAEKDATVEWWENPEDRNSYLIGAVSGPFSLHETHSWGDWQRSETHHWKECGFGGCAQKNSYGAHRYDDDLDAVCNDCQYVRTVAHVHSWAPEWSYDSACHWHECTAPGCDITGNGQKGSYGPHSYYSDGDTACRVCGCPRTVAPPVPTPPSGPSGGSSDSVWYVTVERADHGKVTSNRARASSGSTVTLTVAPVAGYALDALTVTDSRGTELELTAKSDGRYTFNMPSRDVTVRASFAPLPKDGEEPCGGGADCPSRRFPDVGGVGTWYHEAVDFVLRNGLMDGSASGNFVPDGLLTRAMLAQILYNQAGRPPVTGDSPFADVLPGRWYANAVIWASRNGLVEGFGGGRFAPDEPVTREQLAVMLWRYAGSPAAAEKELRFRDANEASGYALGALRWAVENGVVNGYEDGRLEPGGPVTRAQAAQMLMNFFRL